MPAWPDRFFVEFDTDAHCPFPFTDDPIVVLFFASWAYSAEFGGAHELAEAAQRLRRTGTDLKPLLRYADRNVETEVDRRELERSWQPAADLAGCARAVAERWEHPDEGLAPLIAGYEHLAPRLRELAAMCDWAAVRNANVRLSFDLENTEQRSQRPAGM
ncbi:MAG: hypothetical protein DWG83_00665 [Chloroflexi bacterium]|nr:hypothetical protein [Chloroflexota bacterium]MDA1240262.1 hypothetical protein [Chloroflexota bacterium]MQC19072.1 hypothetical protein [Chloroflexota bacterium]